MKRIAILGSALSGGAGQIIEVLMNSAEQYPVLILDNDPNAKGKDVFGVNVVGSTNDLIDYWNKKMFDEAIIAIGGDLLERKKIFDILIENKIEVANIIDDSVKFGLNVKMGMGNVILNNTYIGNNVIIGDNNYILNHCSVQHDSKIKNHNYFATNVVIGAKVKIGDLNRFKIKCALETNVIVENSNTIDSLSLVKFVK